MIWTILEILGVLALAGALILIMIVVFADQRKHHIDHQYEKSVPVNRKGKGVYDFDDD